jgi:hypothetical protein
VPIVQIDPGFSGVVLVPFPDYRISFPKSKMNYCNRKYCNKNYNNLSCLINNLPDSAVFPLLLKTKKAWTDAAQAFLVEKIGWFIFL